MIHNLLLRFMLVIGVLVLILTGVLSMARAGGESKAIFLAVASRDGSLTINRFDVQGQSQILYHQDVYNPVDMAWSPNGRSLLLTMYHHYDSEGGRLIVVDAIRLGNRRIFSIPEIHSAAKWSGDGREIVVVGAMGFDDPLTLYHLRADDGHVLHTYPLPDACYQVDRLAWVDQQTARVSYLTSHGDRHTVHLDLSTGDFTSQPDEPFVRGVLSPDGEWVVALEKQDSEYALVRSRPDGSDPLVLTDEAFAPGLPDWSPDSQWISFTNLIVSTRSDVYRVRVDGSELQILTDNNRNNATWLPLTFVNQAWSPEGRWRVLYSQVVGSTRWDLRLYDARTQQDLHLMDVQFEIRAEWSPPIDLPTHGWWLGLLGAAMVVGVGGCSFRRRFP